MQCFLDTLPDAVLVRGIVNIKVRAFAVAPFPLPSLNAIYTWDLQNVF